MRNNLDLSFKLIFVSEAPMQAMNAHIHVHHVKVAHLRGEAKIEWGSLLMQRSSSSVPSSSVSRPLGHGVHGCTPSDSL